MLFDNQHLESEYYRFSGIFPHTILDLFMYNTKAYNIKRCPNAYHFYVNETRRHVNGYSEKTSGIIFAQPLTYFQTFRNNDKQHHIGLTSYVRIT